MSNPTQTFAEYLKVLKAGGFPRQVASERLQAHIFRAASKAGMTPVECAPLFRAGAFALLEVYGAPSGRGKAVPA